MKLDQIQPGKVYLVDGGFWKCVGIHPSVPRQLKMECVWPIFGEVQIFSPRVLEREVTDRELAQVTKKKKRG